MAIQIQGNSAVVAEVSGTTHRALRVEQRPLDYGALGHYRLSMLSGTMAAGLAADSEIYQFHWTHASNLAAIHAVICDGVAGSATAFTAGFGRVYLTAARSFTVAGGSGNTATITGNNAKSRTSMGTTTLGEIRCSATGALTAGTKTLDTQAMGQISLTFGTVASVQYCAQIPLIAGTLQNEHPLILATNEGFAVRATVPATGTWQFGITTIWSELTSY